MPRELMDAPKTSSFSFPGLEDKSAAPAPDMAVPETQDPQEPKKTRAKKEAAPSASGRKPLKLGKSKG